MCVQSTYSKISHARVYKNLCVCIVISISPSLCDTRLINGLCASLKSRVQLTQLINQHAWGDRFVKSQPAIMPQ